MTINSSQVVTLAAQYKISGIRVSGNKPFAAFSGTMFGRGLSMPNYDYAMVTCIIAYDKNVVAN